MLDLIMESESESSILVIVQFFFYLNSIQNKKPQKRLDINCMRKIVKHPTIYFIEKNDHVQFENMI